MNKLTKDFTYFGPLFLFLQDESEFGADVDMADVVQQNPDHAPGQMHEATETHEPTELERRQTFTRSNVFFFYVSIAVSHPHISMISNSCRLHSVAFSAQRFILNLMILKC